MSLVTWVFAAIAVIFELYMDPMRRLLSNATMYVHLDMLPNFFETLVSFIRKSKLCGKKYTQKNN